MLLLKMLKKAIQLILNILFVIQIIIMLIVFFTAAYWFFSLANTRIFSFAEPIANSVTNFMHIFYTPKVVLGDTYVDASLLLFDIIALCIASFISFGKHYIYRLISEVDALIAKLKQMDEDNFNKTLKKEADSQILKFNTVALLIEIELEDLLTKKLRNNDDIDDRNVEMKEKEAFELLLNEFKNLKDCKLAKSGKKLLIISKEFSKIDGIVFYVEKTIIFV